MKKIIVIGAGHGGLTAAIKLSREGYDVTIYEKQKKGTLGHDWEDCFSPTLLKDYAGIDTPLQWRYNQSSSFVSPAKRTRINLDGEDNTPHQYLWRKPALELLTSEAEAAGAKIIYEANATAPIEVGGVVTGAVIDGKDVFADLVIDAAGVLSPIRSKLSDACAIEQNLNRGDVFYAYRAYFDNLDTENKAFKAFEIYLDHNREQGLSWCTTNDDNVDVLIGRIDPITKEQVEKQIESFREDHKHIGTKILNGGQTGIIPVRRPLSIMVCDGYAAVGDSAFMTEPMNGSGINLSVKAGALLADAVIKHKGVCTAANLWDYNRDYHKMYGALLTLKIRVSKMP